MNFWNESIPEVGEDKQVLTVRQLNEAISDAMRQAFPSTVWVRGEVQRLPLDAARRTHVYFELHETGQSGAAEYQIPVSLMGWDRKRYGLARFLDGTDPDFQIANKMEVCLECQVDYYAKFGKLSLKIVGVDKSFSLGKLEASRRATLAYLQAEELLEKNASIALSEIPLRVGLVTSPGSAAEKDFMTGIEGSPYGFEVFLRGARMQGEQLQGEVMAALAALQKKAVDVIVITRGGGSRADLSWFDQKDLAVAIAHCQVPVITAIGHEIDRSIADMVAHHSCKTPTAAAEFLVDRVDEAAGRVEEAAQFLRQLTEDILDRAHQRIEVGPDIARAARALLLNGKVRFQSSAGRLQNVLTSQLNNRRRKLTRMEARLATRVSESCSRAQGQLDRRSMSLQQLSEKRTGAALRRLEKVELGIQKEAIRPLGAARQKLDNLAIQAKLLNPERLLARGYTLTLDEKGQIINSADSVGAGDILRTRFVDGDVDSVVQPQTGLAKKKKGKGKARDGKSKKENPGQETLFQ